MTFPIAATMAVALGAVVLFISDRVRIEIVGVGVLAVLLLFFQVMPLLGSDGRNLLGPEVLLSGFANTGLLALAGLLIVAKGLTETGALGKVASMLNRKTRDKHGPVLLFILLVAGIGSSFINNTPIVLMFIPVLLLVDSERMPPNRTLIPLSYASILGGMTTLVGSSTNLVAAGVATDLGVGPFSLFSFTIPGLIIAGAGIVYVVAILPWLLPRRARPLDNDFKAHKFVTEFEVRADSPLVGEQADGNMFPALPEVTVFSVRRGLKTLLPPFEDVTLHPGDVLVVSLLRKHLESMREHLGGSFRRTQLPPVTRKSNVAQFLSEVMVAPKSTLTGIPNFSTESFRFRTDCTIVGIRRTQNGDRNLRPVEMPLQTGDVLIIQGSEDNIQNLRRGNDVIPLEWSATELPNPRYLSLAVGIFVSVILAASSGMISITTAALVGAFLMLATGTLSIEKALSSLDSRVIIPVVAMLGLSQAMQITGAAAWLAGNAIETMESFGLGPAAMMSALFLMVALTTDMLTNNAAAVLFMPVAIGMAQILGVDPFPFAVTVIFAANMSFSTPFGYQTNLLVMKPGDYRALDYLRSGPPLTLICWTVFTLFVPAYYGVH